MRTPQAMTPAEKASLRQLVVTLTADYISQKEHLTGAIVELLADREGLMCNVTLRQVEHGWESWQSNPHAVDNTSLRHAILCAVDAGACLLAPEDIAGHHESLSSHPRSGPLSIMKLDLDGEISAHMKLKAIALKQQLREWVKTSPISPSGVEYYLEGLT